MENIYAYFHFSWVIFFTQNSNNLFLKETKKQKFHNNKYFDIYLYISTFDGYESSTQCTALPKVDIWSNFLKKEKKKSD